MYLKTIVFFAIVACAVAHQASSYASYDNHVEHSYHHLNDHRVGQHDDHHDHHEHHYEPNHHPKYVYKYGVEDKHTHDTKSAEEQRDGDVVKGWYKLEQPDGRTRIVHYTANKHNGFNADVKYSGNADHPHHY